MQETGLKFSPHLPPAKAPGITVRLSLPAEARIRTHAQVNGYTVSVLLRELIRLGWGVAFGTQIDVPLGVDLPIAGAVQPAEQEAA